MRTFIVGFLALMLLTGCERIDTTPRGTATNQDTTATPRDTTVTTDRTSPQATVEPDNTAVNKRDADGTTKTPIDQNEYPASDVDKTAKIRARVLEVKDLSIDGRNVKIITANGKVTLRGPVKSDTERESIERIAIEIAGEGNVDNQLEVARTASANPER
jgi:hyperosmotically inducible protein